MKQKNETDDTNKFIYRKKRKDIEMPHVNSQENSMLNNMEEYDEYEYIDDHQHKQDQEGYEGGSQMFNYGFYDDSSTAMQSVYVNIKQLGCIKKRKMRREYLDSLMIQPKNTYLHESRHRHAMKRLRAPSGRFLTKEETEEFLKKQANEE